MKKFSKLCYIYFLVHLQYLCLVQSFAYLVHICYATIPSNKNSFRNASLRAVGLGTKPVEDVDIESQTKVSIRIHAHVHVYTVHVLLYTVHIYIYISSSMIITTDNAHSVGAGKSYL